MRDPQVEYYSGSESSSSEEDNHLSDPDYTPDAIYDDQDDEILDDDDGEIESDDEEIFDSVEPDDATHERASTFMTMSQQEMAEMIKKLTTDKARRILLERKPNIEIQKPPQSLQNGRVPKQLREREKQKLKAAREQ